MQPDSANDLRDFRITPRTFFLCVVALFIGVAGALIAAALTRMIGFFTNLFYYHRLSFAFLAPYPNHLGIAAIGVPVIGALLIGLMARFGSEKIRGHGIPEAMEAILIGRSVVSPKVALLKPISAAISIGSGGPFGAEGPIIMSGGSFGSVIGQLLHVTAAERKIFLLCGAAAGMSATFHAPIASVLFAVELLAFEFRLRSLVPIALASGVADYMRTLISGNEPVFPSHLIPESNFGILILAVLFGVVGSLLAYALTKAIYGVEELFEKLPLHWMWWPAIGGVCIGIGGFFVPRTLGVGYDTIGQLANGQLLIKGVLLFLLVKAAIWVIALGSGTSGGILAPLLIIGGTLGYGVSELLHIGQPGVWAMLGMAALFAGVTRSPLTSILFLLELTHDLPMLFPTLLTCAVAAAVSAIILPRSILTEKIARRGRHIARDYVVHPLELQRASQVAAQPLISFYGTETPFEAFRKMKSDPEKYRHKEYPVLNEAGSLLGVIHKDEMERIAALPETRMGSLAACIREAATISGDATIMTVLHRMLELNQERLVVTDCDGRPIGIVSRQSILAASKPHLIEETHRERILGWVRQSRQPGFEGRRKPTASI